MLELATIAEYLPDLKPRIVLWFYFEGNDLHELEETEKESPLLMEEFHGKGMRQNLAASAETADALRIYFQGDYEEYREAAQAGNRKQISGQPIAK